MQKYGCYRVLSDNRPKTKGQFLDTLDDLELAGFSDEQKTIQWLMS